MKILQHVAKEKKDSLCSIKDLTELINTSVHLRSHFLIILICFIRLNFSPMMQKLSKCMYYLYLSKVCIDTYTL